MGEEGAQKGQNQRKRRQERESCINNVKINSRRSLTERPSVDNSTYTKHQKPHKSHHQRGSLENVSSDPWGDSFHSLQQCGTLRRSRSLAISSRDEDVFNGLDARDTAANKPRRSQLIPRAKLIERAKEPRYAVVRGCSADNLHPIPDLTLTPPDYSPPRPAAPLEAVYASITNLAGPKFAIGKQHDSLDSNYQNKTSINTDAGVSYEDIPILSLPNYYPDSKYDTDNTDAISFADDLSSYGDNLSKKYSSCDNISTGKWTITEPESIPYDENIVLSTNRPLYDSIKENHYAKPRTIRGPTPYNSEKQTYYRDKRRSYSSDSSEDKNKENNNNNDHDNISLEYFETDKNLDEIKLNNENITKIVEAVEEIKEEEEEEEEETLKTNIEVVPPEENEEYKTIVTVDPDQEETEEEKNKHSHNYLKEFLESQKGSKKPLQNFITKKLSNLSRKSTNLIDNRFYSLPDLAVTKSLRKCEKIDRKLRKCEKIKKPPEGGQNRFIVNIGKHFDITANSSIPVDFELKIAKVPRKSKKKSKHKTEEQFIEAVKSLKETLNQKLDENHNITKPEIVAVTTKMEGCKKEYEEKLGTMRTYWGKMVNADDVANDREAIIEGTPPKCKIVDVQTKVEDVKKKFEPEEKEPEKPNKVQIARQLFEKKPIEKVEKLSPFIKETCNYFESSKPNYCLNGNNNNQYESLNPNIVEIVSKEEAKVHRPIGKTTSITSPEFDHVRYRVMKSDLFQKKIFANCEKESQFDGLMQYLQDYSFQELLRDNNIVIIEPIRTKIPHEPSKKKKAPKNVTPLLHAKKDEDQANLNRHFFYHPIRVNKEVNDDELPNPDTVKHVRQLFEGGLMRSQSSQQLEEANKGDVQHDPDKDHCSATDSNSNPSNISDFGSNENLYDSLMEHCCEKQYVSEDVMEKIRECGTTVTYYGGRVVKKQSGQPVLTKAIMEEIRNNEIRSGECNCNRDIYQGVKFRLIKSNSCNSRLELVGTSDLQEAKERYLKHRQNLTDVKELDKNVINESIKKGMDTQPKIIAEERKMTQWGDVSKEKTYAGINFSNTSKPKIMYNYHNYDNLKSQTMKIDEMEFEPYEVA